MLTTMIKLIALILFSSLLIMGQSSYGRLNGRITDQQQAVTPGAQIRLIQVETGITASGVANAEGLYEFPSLLPGAYQISVELQGFKKYSRSGVIVRVGDVVEIDITLELGSMAESISVTTEAPLLDTASASMGQVVDNRMLSEAPLGGRGVNYLMQLSPGVISTNAPMHGWLPQARDSVSNMAVAGSRTRSSEFTLDGIPNMARDGIIAFQPPPEMIQEFRVQTAAYDASLGRFTGASINMVLKSGANAYHGSLFFSHLSRPLMTRPFFVNRNLFDTRSGPLNDDKANRLWPATRTNRYRGQLGGPVIIPRLYNGKNRTFFSYGNDFMQRTFANLNTATVPTVEQRRGNFAPLLAISPQYQIYDPATIAPAAAGRFSRQPIPGNVIPASRLSPISQRLLDYYPLPNATGTVDGRNNFFGTAASLIDYWSHMLRVDQVVNERQRFYVSYSMMRTDGDQGRNLVNDAIGNITTNKYYSLAFDYVWMLRPNLVANVRYGFIRQWNVGGGPTLGLDLAALGLPTSLTNQLDRNLTSLPTINIDGYQAIGTNLPSSGALNTHYANASISHNRGSHTLRFGGEYRAVLDNQYDYGNYSPSFTFGAAWARGPLDNSPVAPIGQGLASMLLGLPTDGFIDRNTSLAERSAYMGLFLQDDWKVTRKVTVTAGLRWEAEPSTTERYNRANRGFDFNATNPADAAARAAYARSPIAEIPVSQFSLRGGLLFAGVGGVPRGQWNTDRNNFAPRVGVAYQVGPRTVLRTGYGVFFDPLGADRADAGQLGFNQRTRMNPSNDNGQTFRSTLANPYPDGLLAAQGAAGGLTTYLGLAPSFFYPQRKNAYGQRWSFNVQHQLSRNMIVEAGYTGNRGTGLGVSTDLNAIPIQYLSRTGERNQANIDLLTSAVTNPFRGLSQFASSPAFFNNQNVSRTQLLLPYPQYTGLSTTNNDGFSWYHAGHVRLEKRFHNGFSLSGHYTFSKFMEAVERLNGQDLYPTKTISPQDRPHHIAMSGMWDIPVGRNRRYFGKAPRAVDFVAGGWSINAIYQWQSGPPIGFGDIIFRGNLADIVVPYADRTVERWFNIDAGFERDPAKQLAQNYRTFPLRLTGLRADGWNNWDIALFKQFTVKESLKLQLRAEAADAFNHAMFAAPVTGVVNTAFGQVNNTIWSEQRKVTVAAKLSW